MQPPSIHAMQVAQMTAMEWSIRAGQPNCLPSTRPNTIRDDVFEGQRPITAAFKSVALAILHWRPRIITH